MLSRPFLAATHTLVSAQEITGTPPPSATAPPCCLSVAQAPLSSARPHLWLLTARSGWQQRPDARTCSEKGQGPAGQEEEEEEECAHILEHRENPAHLSSTRLSPTAFCIPAAASHFCQYWKAPSVKRTLSCANFSSKHQNRSSPMLFRVFHLRFCCTFVVSGCVFVVLLPFPHRIFIENKV